jgi:hypothetical protein
MQLVQVLPWLMVSTGPLLPADLTQLATTRALSCLLELRLSTTEDGLLCNRGEPPPPFTLPQVGWGSGAGRGPCCLHWMW